MEESEHIKKLEEIIPKLNDLTMSNSPNVEYMVDNGTSFGFNLYNIPEIAVMRVFMSKDTSFPKHNHDEIEYLLVYKGSLKVHIDEKPVHANVDGVSVYDNDFILNVSDGCFLPRGVSHSGEALEDSWLLCITIPSGKGYPNDKS